MRTLLLLPVLLLAAPPAEAQDPSRPPEPAVEKIALSHLDVTGAIRVLVGGTDAPSTGVNTLRREGGGLPPGVHAILGYPLDNSLLVRGTSADIARLRRGVGVIDVPIRVLTPSRSRAEIRPVNGDPGQIRAEGLKLRNTGTIERHDGALQIEGPDEWLRRVLALAARVEIAAGAAPGGLPEPLTHASRLVGGGTIRITLPANSRAFLEADHVDLNFGGETVASGRRVVLKTPDGLRIEGENIRIRISRPENGISTVVIESQPDKR